MKTNTRSEYQANIDLIRASYDEDLSKKKCTSLMNERKPLKFAHRENTTVTLGDINNPSTWTLV
jgi:hypothetical protein